jgi:hypothetical protein
MDKGEIRKTLTILFEDANNRDMLELSAPYGHSAMRLGREVLDEGGSFPRDRSNPKNER